jgi:hypothetical protein
MSSASGSQIAGSQPLSAPAPAMKPPANTSSSGNREWTDTVVPSAVAPAVSHGVSSSAASAAATAIHAGRSAPAASAIASDPKIGTPSARPSGPASRLRCPAPTSASNPPAAAANSPAVKTTCDGTPSAVTGIDDARCVAWLIGRGADHTSE